MPPVLHVALAELSGCGGEDVAARDLRRRVDVGHRILQLIAKAERAAGLV